MFEYFVATYGVQIMTALLCALFGSLGYGIKKLCARYLTDATKKAVAMVSVQFVEQVWTTIHGPDKLAKALEKARLLLEKKGIIFDTEEMEILIEAAVGEFNKAAKSEE